MSTRVFFSEKMKIERENRSACVGFLKQIEDFNSFPSIRYSLKSQVYMSLILTTNILGKGSKDMYRWGLKGRHV